MNPKQDAGLPIVANQRSVASPARTAVPTTRLEHDPERLGALLAQSGYFEDTTQAAQAVVKILAGKELGFPAIASMTGIKIVKNNVTLTANLMAAAIKRSGKYNYRVKEHDNTKCVIAFFENGEEIETPSVFTIEDAQAAGLTGGAWKNYPRNMLFARALSNGAKWHCADVFGGPVYTPDELGEEIDGETGEVLTPAPTHIEREQVTTEQAAAFEGDLRARGLTVKQCVALLRIAGATVSPDADADYLSRAIYALTPNQLDAAYALLRERADELGSDTQE